ncbi:MAG: 16S rRNA (cytidine(1402)-2'-O)-methyltransferase [Anaerolineales bacterium]|nr:16S rRNA (cytidine(1402)-2'-O)-methyltransferase [Anaerolineales bacterium]
MGALYLVATPIGNLEDITARALRVLREVNLIAAEDTRHTRGLLAHFDIHTPLTSYFEHNKLAKLDVILAALETGDVALVSDAGMPALSDPGYELVRAALAAGHDVIPIPGPSAITAALAASGLPTDAFVYLGFLPRKAGERRRLLESLRAEPRTLVAFESPHRLLESLTAIRETLGDRRIAVARELTKMFEEIYRGTVGEAHAHFSAKGVAGEFTLVIAGAAESPKERWDAARVRAELDHLIAAGMKRKDAAKQIAERSGWSVREVYGLDR